MNKRIQELAEQAGFGQQWFEEHPTGCSLPKPLMLREFAELIIRECATVQHKRFCEHGDVSWDILMEHFGVEE